MSHRRTLAQIALISAVAAALASCNSDPTPSSASPTTANSAPTSLASPSATSPSPEERDKKASVRAVVNLWSELDKLASDPRQSLNSLAKVTHGQALAQWQSNISGQRARQWKQTGEVTVTSPSSSYSGNNAYQVTACIDVSKVNVVDASGKSVLSAGRPDRTKYTYEVTKGADGFYVTKDAMKGSPC